MPKACPSLALQVVSLFILACPINGATTSAVCTWTGTAPFCKGKCPSGQTHLPSNSQKCGSGKCCWTGSKALCCTLPSCPVGFEWAENGAQLDPCYLASQISEACAPSSQQEILSSDENSYAPPTAKVQTLCTCSTPLYFLASACAFCQGGTYIDWKTWSAACTRVVTTAAGLTASASGIPDLPSWSLLNITSQPSFDPKVAQDVAEGIPVPSSSSIASVASATSTTTSPSSPPTVPAQIKTHSGSAVGGAVGGTIGGIALILLAACAIWFISLRSRGHSSTQAPKFEPATRDHTYPPQKTVNNHEQSLGAFDVPQFLPRQRTSNLGTPFLTGALISDDTGRSSMSDDHGLGTAEPAPAPSRTQ